MDNDNKTAPKYVSTKSLLGTSAHWAVNKTISERLENPMAALLLAWLIDREDYHFQRKEVVNRDNRLWFYVTTAKIEEQLYLAYRPQKRLIDLLEEHQLIDTRMMNRPAKKYFSIDHLRVLCLAMDLSFDELQKLVGEDGQALANRETLAFAKCESLASAKRESLAFAKRQSINKRVVLVKDKSKRQALTDLSAADSPQPTPDEVENGGEEAATGDTATPPPSTAPKKKKKKVAGKKKKKSPAKKIDGLTIDPAFQACLKAFHERHQAYHQVEGDEESYIPIDWDLGKERGGINRLAKSIRKMSAKKQDCKPAEVDVETIARGLTAILRNVEEFTDRFIALNHYTPAGIHSHWSKIINRIQTKKNASKESNYPSTRGRGKSQNPADLVDREEVLASYSRTRYS